MFSHIISQVHNFLSEIHKLFGQKANYYQIKALDFASCSYLLIIGLLTSFMDVLVH
jgi:hypothetical protein